MSSSSSNDNLRSVATSASSSSIGDKRPPIKNVLPNRYMAAIKQGADSKKTKIKPPVSKLPEIKNAPKTLAPVKVQSQPSLSDEDRLDHLYTIYLQRKLHHAYVQEEAEFINNIQNDTSTVAIIDEYLTSEKNWLQLLASEKVCDSINDLAKIEDVNHALDVLHPFVTHKETVEQVQNMENALSAALDVIPVNIPIEKPLEFSELKDSVQTLDTLVNEDNFFSLNLEMETLKGEVVEDLTQTRDNIEKKNKIKTKLSKVTSLKICDSYSSIEKDISSCKEATTVYENAPIYQSTPFPS